MLRHVVDWIPRTDVGTWALSFILSSLGTIMKVHASTSTLVSSQQPIVIWYTLCVKEQKAIRRKLNYDSFTSD